MKLRRYRPRILTAARVLSGILPALLAATAFGLPVQNDDFTNGLNGWTPGWKADEYLSVKAAGPDTFLQYLRESKQEKSPNAVLAQSIHLEQDKWYTLKVDYRADQSLMPLIVLKDPKVKQYHPIRLFRLPATHTRGSFESRLNILRHSENLSLEIYPGVSPDEPLVNHTYPASFQPGKVEIYNISIEPSSFTEPPMETEPVPFNTETVVYKKVDGMELVMEIDTPEHPPAGNMPVAFWVHGGGWVTGSPDKMKWRSAALVPKGVVGFRVQYRLIKDGGTFPKTFQDLLDAVQWIRDHAEEYHLDLSRFLISGGSAGGHLSSILAQKTPECSHYIGMCGLYDLTNLGVGRFAGKPDAFILGHDPEHLQNASAYYNLRANPPATLLIHGMSDATIDYMQAVHFAEKIRSCGGQAETLLLEGTGHDFGYMSTVDQTINRFLSETDFFSK